MGFLFMVLGTFIQAQTVFAVCTNPDAPVTDSCVTDNCAATPLGNTGACKTAVQQCSSASVGSITQWGTFGSNTDATCSNALRSCYAVEVDTTACNDNGVLARITECNDGTVNADGQNHCGVDNAIDDRNVASGGEDFKTNKGIKDQRKTDGEAACNNQKGYTIQQVTDCQNNIDKDLDACYSSSGGTASKIDKDTYNNCMIGKANSTDCGPRGGNWDDATKKCTVPPPAAGSTGCNDNSTPDPTTGKCANGTTAGEAAGPGGSIATVATHCGEARVNLLVCGTDQGAPAINNVLKIAITTLTFLIGIAAVGGLAWASVQYAKAEDDSGKVSDARGLIRNIVIGLLLYGFLIAIINWLIPGGVFS